MLLLNYKFRLYPTQEQEHVLEQTLDGCRWIYNYFLSIPSMSEYDMNYTLTELKEQYPWLRNYHSKMLQMVPKSLAVRTHVCPYCGLVIDRDYNSAIVVKQRGRALLCLPQELRQVTPVETRRESLKQEEAIGLYDSSSLAEKD